MHKSNLVSYRLLLCLTACFAAACSMAHAGGFFRNAAVGGVSIDTNGVLKQPTAHEVSALRQDVEGQLAEIPQGMDTELGLRRVSLRQLEAALQESGTSDLGRLPDEIRFLAGLQRVQYVLVYPEQQDIVLVGPAEGWRMNAWGHPVGKTTGRPVLQLEDLLVAFQASRGTDMISCSIDPTEAGTRAMQQYVRRQKKFSPHVVDEMARQLGAQQITLTGVPETSHFARVLVAADYRMKRIAMQLEASPLESLPSFLQMMAKSRVKITNMMPRWWLACDYEPLARSEDGLAWELRGQGVRVQTEDSLVKADGSYTPSGKKSPIAARWADSMTRQYDELSKKEAVFGQLRNLMDLSVIAALVQSEGLMQKANCALPTITGENGEILLEAWNPPKTVASQCSFIKRGRDYLITASGGVEIDAYRYAKQSQVSKHVSSVHEQNKPGNTWWW